MQVAQHSGHHRVSADFAEQSVIHRDVGHFAVSPSAGCRAQVLRRLDPTSPPILGHLGAKPLELAGEGLDVAQFLLVDADVGLNLTELGQHRFV